MKSVRNLAVACAVACAAGAAFAQSVQDIMTKSLSLPRPEYSTTTIQMDFIAKDGSVEKSELLKQYGKDTDGLVYTVFDFTARQM